MSDGMCLEERWPEAFEGLTEEQRHGLIQAFAAQWHEGWIPNREDVVNATDLERGTITSEQYRQRVYDAARRRRDERAAASREP